MAAFIYRDGDVAPPNVTRVVVHPSVRILPPGVFRQRTKLEEIQLHNGLEEIGEMALYFCVSLRRLNCPSTVVRIGNCAFLGCTKLEEVQLHEGLEEIEYGALNNCKSLRFLNIPSTVVRIGDVAFYDCAKLEEVQLHEGLKEIGEGAFWGCNKLSVLELVGIIKVETDAFLFCNSLERIRIPSRAFVVQRGNSRLVTDQTIAPTDDAFVLIAPRCLKVLPESNLTELGNSIGTIMNNDENTVEDRLDRVHQAVRKEVCGEVSTILGLAFWKAKIVGAKRGFMDAANNFCKNEGGGGKRAKVSIVLTGEAREGCRGEGKGKLIAENVLPFLYERSQGGL